jgi:hypothetical protein
VAADGLAADGLAADGVAADGLGELTDVDGIGLGGAGEAAPPQPAMRTALRTEPTRRDERAQPIGVTCTEAVCALSPDGPNAAQRPFISMTERMLPAGSLNHAMAGPWPR